MEQLAGDLLNDSDSDDQDYVPPEGEVEEVPEEINSDAEENSDDGEEQKKRTDALWADFMADVEPIPKKPKLQAETQAESTKEAYSNSKTEQTDQPSSSGSAGAEVPARESANTSDADTQGTSSGKVKITQVFDFAGEKIEVEKEVEAGSKEAKKLLADQEKQKQASEQKTVLVRPKVGGGLSTVVGSILNKKNKMSVLEKSKLDWNGFKRQEGIDEELATFNRGKGGYLEKMAFLERADLRQFDLEKAMREKKRNR
ncbi:craniofacial development protein 1 [Galendromus occidentalis]|uniref:Craniofacial development protein 1 n=1 Tax=Galendromus occidentalis TaxID=34638 RepID=A0AAJ6QSF0_9ACAR|nr:craniofacial development protein 1 [Galendromus occidentalis]